MASPSTAPVPPSTIFRHAAAVFPAMAMLAGLQLDVFTALVVKILRLVPGSEGGSRPRADPHQVGSG
jgi:hypothetical protein